MATWQQTPAAEGWTSGVASGATTGGSGGAASAGVLGVTWAGGLGQLSRGVAVKWEQVEAVSSVVWSPHEELVHHSGGGGVE